MKQTVLLLAMLGIAMSSYAQDTSKLYYKIWHYYEQLDRNDQSTTVLYDRTLPFSNIYKFDGIYDTFNTRKNWLQMYTEMKMAAYDTTIMLHPDTVNARSPRNVLKPTST